MTHATTEEIHDHAYGFRLSEHVAECADCGRTCEQVTAERETLRDILAEEETPEIPVALLRRPRPAPRRVGPSGLAAAALFLAALSWMLMQRDPDRGPAAPALASQESEIDRLFAEMKSSSPVRKKLATFALAKYGGAAYEALALTNPTLSLSDAVRGETEDDKALVARLKKSRITLKAQGLLYTDVVQMLRPHVGQILVDLNGYEFDTAVITLDLENAPVYEAIEKLSAQMKLPFGVQFGRVVIGKRSDPISRAPVRIAARPADVARLIADLSNDDPSRREDASSGLRRLGFGAESALWEALDAASPETRGRAEGLLQELYAAVAPRETLPAGWEKRTKVAIDADDIPLQDAITDILRQAGGLPMVWNSRIVILEEHVSFKAQDIVPEGALTLLLQPRGINCIVGSGCALMTSLGVRALPTPSPGPLWCKPAEARELETLIADLASSDPQRQEKGTRRLRERNASRDLEVENVLDALAAASWALEGDALRRCQGLRRTIAASHRMWFTDIPSGADLQTLTAGQRALLDARVALPASDALTLEQLLKRDGVRSNFRAPAAASYRGMGKEPTRLALLKVVLRPEGLDFYLDGETIIVDTAERVQAAVEK